MRIQEKFSQLKTNNQKGFVPFITAGDPDLEKTKDLILALARVDSTVIELGVPFSDPMADGVVIQKASERALKNNFGIAEILELVKDVRKETDVPIILFSYFNPLLQYGLEKLCADAKEVGIDGFLVTDLVPEEAGEFSSLLKKNDLDMIFLIAPTSSDERLKMVAERASGFIYAVSRTGVTGTRETTSQSAEVLVNRMRQFSDLPIAVGFGISTAEQVAETWKYADAAVVGSAIVREIEKFGNDESLGEKVEEFAGNLLPK
ncbi:MAG TPA: tryptophan synthase subunit alpha [Pyrinomonadaceae bacterium]|nr:tryptophan synthase subunit alpha [Pyrinomonadaceae bacterium]